MRNDLRILRAALLLTGISCLSATLQAEPSPADRKILELLPGEGGKTPGDPYWGYWNLQHMWPQAQPVLCGELLVTTRETTAINIVSLLVENPGNKAQALDAMRKVLCTRTGDTPEEAKIRAVVIDGLAEIGTGEDVALLQTLLKDPQIPVRIHTLQALARIGGENASAAITTWLQENKDAFPNATEEATAALKVIEQRRKGREILTLLANADDDDNQQRLIEMSAQAYPLLCQELLATRNITTMRAITYLLIEGKGDKTLPRETMRKVLATRTSDTWADGMIRGNALHALGRIGTKEDVPLLISYLTSSHLWEPSAASESLTLLADQQAEPALRALLEKNPKRSKLINEVLTAIAVPLEDRHIIELLSKHTSGDENRKPIDEQLTAMGEKAYPALCRELIATEDPGAAGRIVGILMKSKGDKTRPRAAMHQELATAPADASSHSFWGDPQSKHHAVLKGVVELGTNEDLPDLPVLHRLLPSEPELVLRCLTKIGDKSSATAIRVWIHRKEDADSSYYVDDEIQLPLEAITRRMISPKDRPIFDQLIHSEAKDGELRPERDLSSFINGAKDDPALCRILLATESDMLVIDILSVFATRGEEQPEVAAAIRKLLTTRTGHSPADGDTVRRLMIEALGQVGSPDYADVLHPYLQDTEVQWAAFQSLEMIGDARSEPLLRSWANTNPRYEANVHKALETIAIPWEERKILKLLVPDSDCGLDEESELEVMKHKRLVAMGAKAYPALCRELLATNNPFLYSPIIRVFIESKGDKTLPLATMRKALAERTAPKADNVRIREVIVSGLGEIGTKEDLPRLLALLNDPDSSVIGASLESLAKLGDSTTEEAIRVWFKEKGKRHSWAKEQVDKALKALELRRRG